jgi:hypothetical protein
MCEKELALNPDSDNDGIWLTKNHVAAQTLWRL